MNNNKKATKHALLTSVMALVMCVVMLVGTTFAWFTDTASTAVNKIVAGNLDVDIVDENNISLDGESLSFKDVNNNTDILWEPGATFFTQGFKIVNKGNLALKYKVVVSGTTGDAKLLKAIKFDVVTAKTKDATAVSFANEGNLLKQNDSAPANNGVYYLRGHMYESAGNEYKNLTLDGISITVYATQYTYEKDSFDELYDANAGKDTAYYTLAEFNALTEIPEGVKNVHIALGAISLKDGSVVIGNDNLRDKYGRGISNGEITYTDKAGINLIIDGGTIKDGPAVDHAADNKIAFKIPDKSTVTFKNVKIEGFFGLTSAGEDNPYGTPMHGKVASVTFDGCTFDALWLQDGQFYTSQITIKNSTFNKHENSVYFSNTNPLWFKNIGQNGGTNVSIDNCVFNTNRPVKVVEQEVSGQAVSITNCTFNMADDTSNKNAAIMFSTTSNGSTLGNVVVSGNQVNGGVALLAFYEPAKITMASGATFTVSDNILRDGAQISVKWGSNTATHPDFLN